MATRSLVRSIVLQSLYEWDFYNQSSDLANTLERNLQEFGPDIDEPDFAWRILNGVIENIHEINGVIEKAAPEWPLNQISIIDRNILRIGLYELLHADHNEVPPKVAINEAIELGKNFGGTSSSRFINGVLGTVYRQISSEKSEKNEVLQGDGSAVEVDKEL